MVILYVIAIALVTFFIAVILGGWILSAPAYRGQPTDHFDGKRFQNYGGAKAKGFKDIFRWMTSGERRPKWVYKNTETINTPINDFNKEGKAKVFFINHSSFLIQAGGKNFLTDPIYSEYASPFQWAGPQRMRPPGIDFDALPRIDYILLSHNHYDHLDLAVLRKIKKISNPVIFCPLGVDLFLRKKGFEHVQVMDWWDQVDMESFSIHSTPAQHFSARGLFDRDRSLWCGYLVSISNLKLYYVGDTGYGELFKRIGDEYGPMDFSIIPMGAYRPRWFMSPIHCDPAQALQIHNDVKSKLSVACHYGTFPLAIDGQSEPMKELLSLQEYEAVKEQFIILEEGKSLVVVDNG